LQGCHWVGLHIGNVEHRAGEDDIESDIDEPFAVAVAVRPGALSTCILPG